MLAAGLQSRPLSPRHMSNATTWNAGYITADPYMETYHAELSPTRLQYLALLQGWLPPGLDGQFTYCELGFGRGRSLAVHAATHPQARFQGTDFNPAHANEAQQLLKASVANAETFEDSFAEFLDRDGPKFDFIVLHGIWSWVNGTVQRDLCAVLRHKLNSGGLVYFSYNALPAWAPLMPARELMVTLAATLPAGMSLENKAGEALRMMEEMAALKDFAFAGPLKVWLDTARKHGKAYLAHEYLNEHWTPMYFREVAALLDERAKLSYLGPAMPSHVLARSGLATEKRALVQRHPDPIGQETLFDLFAGNTFRQDLFGRGVQRLTPGEHWRLLAATPLVCMPELDTTDETLKFNGGQYKLAGATLEALRALAKNKDGGGEGSITVGQLADHPKLAGLPRQDLIVLLSALCAAELVVPQARGDQAKAAAACQRLNTHLRRQVLAGRTLSVPQASPRTGTAIQGMDYAQAALTELVVAKPGISEGDLAQALSAQIRTQGLTLNDQGKPLTDAGRIEAKVHEMVKAFSSVHRKQSRALAIA